MRARTIWADSPGVDLLLFLAPVILVPLPHFLHVNEGLAVLALGMGVKFLVDAPHLASCWTRTVIDPTFRRDHPWQIYGVVPLIVVFSFVLGAMGRLDLLVLGNFFASIPHGYMQLANLQACYRRRGEERERLRAAGESLAIVFIPTALMLDRLLGPLPKDILGVVIPTAWVSPGLAAGAWVLGLGGLATAIWAEWQGQRRGQEINQMKWAFLGSVFLGYWLAVQVPRLELALLGYLAWHSVQYLALTYKVNRARYLQMRKESVFLATLFRPNNWGFYGLTLLFHGLLIYLAVSILPRFTPGMENAKLIWSVAVFYTLSFSHIFLDATLMISPRYSLVRPAEATLSRPGLAPAGLS